jgi:hypothetical protein
VSQCFIAEAAWIRPAGFPDTCVQTKSAMRSLHGPKQDHLLDALSDAVHAILAPNLEFIDMPLRQVLCEPGETMIYI